FRSAISMSIGTSAAPTQITAKARGVRTETKVSQGAIPKNKGPKTECQGREAVWTPLGCAAIDSPARPRYAELKWLVTAPPGCAIRFAPLPDPAICVPKTRARVRPNPVGGVQATHVAATQVPVTRSEPCSAAGGSSITLNEEKHCTHP